MHRLVVLALPRVVAFDLAIAAQIFGHPDEALYQFDVCTPTAGPVPTTTGFALLVEQNLGVLRSADTVLVPGFEESKPLPEAVLTALRAADRRGARMVSICDGAFALAAAGILDGHQVTTHWQSATALAQRFPDVRVSADVLYIDEGRVLTSAGVAAGIDLCLHIVRRDHGAQIANRIARRMVVAPQRAGGQAQFVERAVPTDRAGNLESTRQWALKHIAEPLTIADLARHANYSERTFARRFRAETGTTPLQWLLTQRLDEVRRLLESSDLPIESIARDCGFASAASLRHHFRRATRTTPSGYRLSWATPTPT